MINTALFSSFPVVEALRGADKFIGEVVREENGVTQNLPLQWRATRGKHLQFDLIDTNYWDPTVRALAGFGPDELSAVAHWDVEFINRFLRKAGYDIQLSPWNSEDRRTFGIAAQIKLQRHWRTPGVTGYYLNDWRSAFRLDQQRAGVEFFKSRDNRVVVRIPTSVRSDYVCVTSAPYMKTHFALLELCMKAQDRMTPYDKFRGVILPNWAFQQEVDVTGLIGLCAEDATGQTWRLVQALMEGSSTFCAAGTSFKAAFAAAVGRESAHPQREPQTDDHIADYDLAMWIMRDGVMVPLSAVYVAKSEFSQTDESLPD